MSESLRAVHCPTCGDIYNIVWSPRMRTLPKCVARMGPGKKCGGPLEFAKGYARVLEESRKAVPLASQEDMEDLGRFLSSDPETGD